MIWRVDDLFSTNIQLIRCVVSCLYSCKYTNTLICARPGQDRIREVFCPQGGNPPLVALADITGLRDLQAALGFVTPTAEENRLAIQNLIDNPPPPPAEGEPPLPRIPGAFRSGTDGVSYAFTGHSSSLVKGIYQCI